MGIDNAIEKMEETLRKKKALRSEKDKSRLAGLEERLKAKTAKLEKVQAGLDKIKAEIEDVKNRMSAESGEDNACDNACDEVIEETTEQFKPEPGAGAGQAAAPRSKEGAAKEVVKKATATRKKQ